MNNKIRKFFGLREKIKLDDVTIFLPAHYSTSSTELEFRSKRFICSKRSGRIVNYLRTEGFISKEKPVCAKIRMV